MGSETSPGSSAHSSLTPSSESGSGSNRSPDDSSVSSKEVALSRQGQTRKGHAKSRLGCFNCKRRRVKCDEHRPSCVPCCRLGLRCQYPARGAQVAEPRQNLTTSISLDDLRFHHRFFTVAYPSLPLKGGDVWTECAAMTHSYDFLAHAALGLGASHLSQNGNVNYNSQALQHRVTAITLVNQQLADTSNKTAAEVDALFAALICIIAQSALMPDGMTDYLVMTRGANLVATSMITDLSRSVFRSFSPEGHMAALGKMICDQPKDLELVEEFKASVLALSPICKSYWEKTYLDCLVHAISMVPHSSFEAWKGYVTVYMMPTAMNNQDFQAFVHPGNFAGQLLLIHGFLLDYILGKFLIAPSDEPKCPGRKNMVVLWTMSTIKRMPPEYEEYTQWLRKFAPVLARQDARYLLSP